MRLGLVSCTKSKQSYQCQAGTMYLPSALFRKAYDYSRRHYDSVGILSAKYGLLLPEEVIDPYELTLNRMGVTQRKRWADKVLNQIEEKIGLGNIREVYFHTGNKYREFLIPPLESMGISCIVPLEGLPLGLQLRWYDKKSR